MLLFDQKIRYSRCFRSLKQISVEGSMIQRTIDFWSFADEFIVIDTVALYSEHRQVLIPYIPSLRWRSRRFRNLPRSRMQRRCNTVCTGCIMTSMRWRHVTRSDAEKSEGSRVLRSTCQHGSIVCCELRRLCGQMRVRDARNDEANRPKANSIAT